MSLENGILLHTNEPIEGLADFPSVVMEYSKGEFKYCYYLCYWIRHWDVRRKACAVFEASWESAGKCWLSIEEIKELWWALTELENETDNNFAEDFLVLEWLIHFMRESDPTAYMVEFYDSY